MNYETLNRMQYSINSNDNIINTTINNVRTTSNRYSSNEKTKNNSSDNEGDIEYRSYDEDIKKESLETVLLKDNITIYRYKFTSEFMNDLHNFSKIHQYDSRKDFKETWKIWVDENSQTISKEVERLTKLGYDGDILNKMFTSARYYFRKKGTEKKEPRQRTTYIGVQQELIDAMDNHIKKNINKEFKPSKGFEDFCKENVQLLKTEVERFIDCNIKDVNVIKKKIKKTYKNRYFVIITK